jgi:hypothetical protein
VPFYGDYSISIWGDKGGSYKIVEEVDEYDGNWGNNVLIK